MVSLYPPHLLTALFNQFIESQMIALTKMWDQKNLLKRLRPTLWLYSFGCDVLLNSSILFEPSRCGRYIFPPLEHTVRYGHWLCIDWSGQTATWT